MAQLKSYLSPKNPAALERENVRQVEEERQRDKSFDLELVAETIKAEIKKEKKKLKRKLQSQDSQASWARGFFLLAVKKYQLQTEELGLKIKEIEKEAIEIITDKRGLGVETNLEDGEAVEDLQLNFLESLYYEAAYFSLVQDYIVKKFNFKGLKIARVDIGGEQAPKTGKVINKEEPALAKTKKEAVVKEEAREARSPEAIERAKRYLKFWQKERQMDYYKDLSFREGDRAYVFDRTDQLVEVIILGMADDGQVKIKPLDESRKIHKIEFKYLMPSEFVNRIKFTEYWERKAEDLESQAWRGLIDRWFEDKLQREIGKLKKDKEWAKKSEDEIKRSAEQQLKQKIQRVFKRVFNNFAVHGMERFDKVNGQLEFKKAPDLDGRVCLGLLELAGWDLLEGENVDLTKWQAAMNVLVDQEGGSKQHRQKIKKRYQAEFDNLVIEYQRQGLDKVQAQQRALGDLKRSLGRLDIIPHKNRQPETVHLDVGGSYGGKYDVLAFFKDVDKLLTSEQVGNANQGSRSFFRLGVIIDHHPDGNIPSTASAVFHILDKFGFFDKDFKPPQKETLKSLIKFVNMVDAYGYQVAGAPEHWPGADRTVLGLSRFMSFDKLWNFFQEDGDYTRQLTDQELERYGLISVDQQGKEINRQQQQRDIIEKSKRALEELVKNGFKLKTKFGEIIIDVEGRVPGGAQAAFATSKPPDQQTGYLRWNSKNKGLFLFVPNNELPADLFKVGDQVVGQRVHKRLWLVKPGEAKGLVLGEVLKILGVEWSAGSQLAKYIKAEEKAGKKKEEMDEMSKKIKMMENRRKLNEQELNRLLKFRQRLLKIIEKDKQ